MRNRKQNNLSSTQVVDKEGGMRNGEQEGALACTGGSGMEGFERWRVSTTRQRKGCNGLSRHPPLNCHDVGGEGVVTTGCRWRRTREGVRAPEEITWEGLRAQEEGRINGRCIGKNGGEMVARGKPKS